MAGWSGEGDGCGNGKADDGGLAGRWGTVIGPTPEQGDDGDDANWRWRWEGLAQGSSGGP